MTISLQDLNSGNFSVALSTGAAVTGQSDTLFKAEAIVGTAASDANTAVSILNTFKTNGSVDLTGDAAQAQMNKYIAVMQLVPVVGQVLGAAIYAITQAGGFAHAGQGICATDPPASASLSDLKAWPHFTAWNQSVANSASPGTEWFEGKDPLGSFEDVANRMLAYNRALQDNCFVQGTIAPPVLLAQIIAAWNGAHQGPTRMVTRTMPGPNIGSTTPGYDPIAEALDQAGWFDAGHKISFPVNAGAENAKVIKLKLGPNGLLKAAPTSSVATVLASPVVRSAAVATGIGAAGVAWYAHSEGITIVNALKRLFKF